MENWLDTLDLSKQEFLKKDEMVDSLMVDYKENLIKEKQDKTTEIKKDVKEEKKDNKMIRETAGKDNKEENIIVEVGDIEKYKTKLIEELKKKFEEKKKEIKLSKKTFADAPQINKDLSNYVILTNLPFVEEEKREKFKETFFKKFVEAIDFGDKLLEFIFPYSNKDKGSLKTGTVILKFINFQQAKLYATTM